MNKKNKINVCLVDDHKLVRDGIGLVLNQTAHIRLVAEAASIDDLIVMLKKEVSKSWNILLLDITLNDENGLHSIDTIRSIRPDLNILVLTMHDESQFGIRAMQAGANGYLTKDNASSELITAIEKICLGKKYISSEFSEFIAMTSFGDSCGPAHNSLSEREFDVFVLLSTGKSPTEISEKLCISIKTVSTYRARIMQKMNMESNADLTRYCLSHKLIV